MIARQIAMIIWQKTSKIQMGLEFRFSLGPGRMSFQKMTFTKCQEYKVSPRPSINAWLLIKEMHSEKCRVAVNISREFFDFGIDTVINTQYMEKAHIVHDPKNWCQNWKTFDFTSRHYRIWPKNVHSEFLISSPPFIFPWRANVNTLITKSSIKAFYCPIASPPCHCLHRGYLQRMA